MKEPTHGTALSGAASVRRHTTGPWYGDPMGTSGIYSGAPVDRRFTGHRIASVEGPTPCGPGSFQEYAANHRLVLMAPALLDAIEAVLVAEAAGGAIDIERLRCVYRSATGEAGVDEGCCAPEAATC